MTASSPVNLKLLSYLEALVTEAHVTRAANKMGIGQPAMSAALGRLRVLLNDPILVPTRKGMQATPRALAAVHRIGEIFQLADLVLNEDRDFDPATSERHFRLMASEGPANFLAPLLMQRVRAAAPQVCLSFTPGDIRESSHLLRNGSCDLVIGNIKAAAPDLRQTILYRQNPVCIASRLHLGANVRLTLHQFLAVPHVVWGTSPVPAPTIESLVDDALAARKRIRRIGLRVPNILMTPAVVAATDMLAVIPHRAAARAAKTLPLKVFPVPLKIGRIDVSMFWHERQHRDRGHVWLRRLLADVANELKTG